MTLTTKQKRHLETGQAVPLTVDGTECVLVRRDVYERSKPPVAYDDSDWTEEEMDALAAEAAQRLDQMPEIQ